MDKIKEWFDFGEKRNEWSSLIAGALVFTGWWFIIDVAAIYPDQDHFRHVFHILGVLATISLVMINTVKNEQLAGDSLYTEGCCGPSTARTWLFIGFIMGFSSIIASIWILIQYFLVDHKDHIYPGVALVLQNVLIFAGSVVFKYGRREE